MADIDLDLTETPIAIDLALVSVSGSFTQAQIDHTVILNRGTKTHTEIDTALTTTIPSKVDKLTQEVIVTSVDDLPTAAGGWHTLADNTIYSPVALRMYIRQTTLTVDFLQISVFFFLIPLLQSGLGLQYYFYSSNHPKQPNIFQSYAAYLFS